MTIHIFKIDIYALESNTYKVWGKGGCYCHELADCLVGFSWYRPMHILYPHHLRLGSGFCEFWWWALNCRKLTRNSQTQSCFHQYHHHQYHMHRGVSKQPSIFAIIARDSMAQEIRNIHDRAKQSSNERPWHYGYMLLYSCKSS